MQGPQLERMWHFSESGSRMQVFLNEGLGLKMEPRFSEPARSGSEEETPRPFFMEPGMMGRYFGGKLAPGYPGAMPAPAELVPPSSGGQGAGRPSDELTKKLP